MGYKWVLTGINVCVFMPGFAYPVREGTVRMQLKVLNRKFSINLTHRDVPFDQQQQQQKNMLPLLMYKKEPKNIKFSELCSH